MSEKTVFKICNIFLFVVIYFYGENHVDYG